MVTKRKQRRRRRGVKKYHTGTHLSTKTNESYKYRSEWELRYMIWLDTNDDVRTYSYEALKITYVSNLKSKRLRNYIPDFLVTMSDGRELLVEIKPKRFLEKPINKKKFDSARAWCAENSREFVILTEIELSALGIMK